MLRMVGLRISAALVIGLAAGVMLVASGSSATATQGQAVIAGQLNTETNQTVVNNTNYSVPSCNGSSDSGLMGCGRNGVVGMGGNGVNAKGTTYGVVAVGGRCWHLEQLGIGRWGPGFH
jgi:hypothetical protein